MNKLFDFISFGEVAEFRNGLNFSKDSKGNGCSIIGVGDFKDYFSPEWDQLSEIDVTGVARKEDYLEEGDILFVRSNGNKELVGRSLYINNKGRKVVFSGFCIRARLISNVVNPKFLAYFTKTPFFKSSISYADGTNINNLSQDVLKDVKIPLFSLDEQKKIADFLSAIDTKISLNKQLIKKCKNLCESLYNYWFIQFDFPDENGKSFKKNNGELIYSDLLKRKIPKNWEARKISSFITVDTKSINPCESPNKVFKLFSIPVFDAKKTYSLEFGKDIGSDKYKVNKKHILVSKLNPKFNRIIYIEDEADQVCSTEFVVWKSTNNYLKNFLYILAHSQQFVDHCIQSSTGTSNSHRRINPDLMMDFIIPYNEEIINSYGKAIDAMIQKMLNAEHEIRELVSLKNWILPMLMNGQISIGNTEEHLAKTFEQNG